MKKSEISKLMSGFGKLAAGKKKKFSKAEIKLRTKRIKQYNRRKA